MLAGRRFGMAPGLAAFRIHAENSGLLRAAGCGGAGVGRAGIGAGAGGCATIVERGPRVALTAARLDGVDGRGGLLGRGLILMLRRIGRGAMGGSGVGLDPVGIGLRVPGVAGHIHAPFQRECA